MAVELEERIMKKIGLGMHYTWHNGSPACWRQRESAVDKLVKAAKREGLTISSQWLSHCRKATNADNVDGEQYTLTNTWIACSHAIQDAISRKDGGAGFSPDGHEFHFFDEGKKRQWESLSSPDTDWGRKRPFFR